MCVIIASPDRQHRPSLATLTACERRNPHGSGLAWLQSKKAHWLKGLSAESIHDLLGVLKGPVVIHFRIATVGGRRPSLCHPFPISSSVPLKPHGQSAAVLFQNGHWSDWEQFAAKADLALDGPVSDTRIAAAGVHQFGPKLLARIEGSRFAILTSGGYTLFGGWQEIGKCHFSNLQWQPQPELDLPTRRRPSRSLVNEAMACFGD